MHKTRIVTLLALTVAVAIGGALVHYFGRTGFIIAVVLIGNVVLYLWSPPEPSAQAYACALALAVLLGALEGCVLAGFAKYGAHGIHIVYSLHLYTRSAEYGLLKDTLRASVPVCSLLSFTMGLVYRRKGKRHLFAHIICAQVMCALLTAVLGFLFIALLETIWEHAYLLPAEF